MKFSFKSFAIGFACAALSLGAVTYVNAAGNGTLKACANKTSGVMRYIAKGSCKKTETSLSWNQMGPQGLPGATGTNGTNGEIGAKGDTGTAGARGQNFHVIDANGRDLGQLLGVYSGGTLADILYEGGIWTLSTDDSYPQGSLRLSFPYSDSACEIPYFRPSTQPTARGWGGNNKYFKAVGKPFMLGTRIFYAHTPRPGGDGDLQDCTISTDPAVITRYREHDWSAYEVTAVTEVSAPVYTAPFTIVAK